MEIYAEISRKQLQKVQGGTMKLPVSAGITCKRKEGSRCCYFEVDTQSAFQQLEDYLDGAAILWQIND